MTRVSSDLTQCACAPEMLKWLAYTINFLLLSKTHCSLLCC